MAFSSAIEGSHTRLGTATAVEEHYPGETVLDGNLQYVVEQGGNDSKPSYQEASGAPVEITSPLGVHVGWLTVVCLNISKMIGTGVYSTPASILTNCGSVGLSLMMWVIGYIAAMSGLSVYTEFLSYFPNRSGSEVVYLEQAYPRPRYFFPLAFAAETTILSFSSSNAIVLAQYLFRIGGSDPSPWQLKGLAVGGYTVAVLLLAFDTRHSLWLLNAISIVKVLTLIFISLTGFIVLGGHTRVEDPHANFRNGFEGTTASGYGITNALVKVVFAYAGYENAFNVVNEAKNPVKLLKKSGPASVTIVAILYMLCNVAFFAAVPKEDLKNSKQVAASLFFEAIFGKGRAARGLNFLIALSSFGNLIAVLIGSSRMIRECGRQGVLPWPKFWISTKPFGTPLGPYFLKWVLTILMILAPPAGDAFNFVVDLANYPDAAFKFAMAIGLYIVRWRRSRIGLSRTEYRAWNASAGFYILVNLYLLIMPWYPPPTGRNGGDVSFWYAAYVVTGIGIILLCGIYFCIWVYLLPYLGKYKIRQEVIVLDDEAVAHKLIKVPLEKLEEWDDKHDAKGRLLQGAHDNHDISTKD